MNDLERQNQDSSKYSAKDRFEEVVNTVYQTASSKGWTVEIKSMDDQTWKYATLYVTRRVGLS